MRKFFSALFAATVVGLAFAPPVAAQTCTSQQCQGTIGSVESTNDYYSFRVTIAGVSVMCPGGPAWAFINVNDANYKSHVSNLLLGRALGASVSVWSTLYGSGCAISNVVV